MIEVKYEVQVYKDDERYSDIIYVGVESFWNRNNKAILVIDGKQYEILINDMLYALENVT